MTNGQEAIAKYRRSLISGNPYALLTLDLTIRGCLGAKKVTRILLYLDPGVKAALFSDYSIDPVFVDCQRFSSVNALKNTSRRMRFNRLYAVR